METSLNFFLVTDGYYTSLNGSPIDTSYKNRDLKVTNKLLYHLKKLWSGYTVRIVDEHGKKMDEM